MKFRLVAVVWVGVAVACATFSVERAPDSIQAMYHDGGSTCTAWSVAPGVWVSAGHCAEVPTGWTIGGGKATVIAVADHADLSLFSGPIAPVLEVAGREPPIGAPIVVYGYGMGKRDLLMIGGLVVSNASAFFEIENDFAPKMLFSGANGLPGISGGPVLYRGRVVSVITAGGMASSPTQLIGAGVSWADLSAFTRLHLGR